MAKKINPDIVDRDGRAALHIAIERKNLTILDRLLDLGCDPDLVDPRGWTVLDRLAEKDDRSSPVVQRLIVAGAQYKKQLPLNPELMRKPKGHDKPTLDKPTLDRPFQQNGFGLGDGKKKPAAPKPPSTN